MSTPSCGANSLLGAQLALSILCGGLNFIDFMFSKSRQCIGSSTKPCTDVDYLNVATIATSFVTSLFMAGVAYNLRDNLWNFKDSAQITDEQLEKGIEKVQTFIRTIEEKRPIDPDLPIIGALTEEERETLKVLCAALKGNLENVFTESSDGCNDC